MKACQEYGRYRCGWGWLAWNVLPNRQNKWSNTAFSSNLELWSLVIVSLHPKLNNTCIKNPGYHHTRWCHQWQSICKVPYGNWDVWMKEPTKFNTKYTVWTHLSTHLTLANASWNDFRNIFVWKEWNWNFKFLLTGISHFLLHHILI